MPNAIVSRSRSKRRSARRALRLAAFALATLIGRAAWAQNVLPTDDEMQLQVDGHHYDVASKMLAKVLMAKGAVVKDNDRFADLMMEAECQLQLSTSDATVGKTLAAAVLEALEQHDISKLAQAGLLDLMLKGSKRGKYVSRLSDDKRPYDVYSPAARKEAAPVIYADAFSAVKEEWRLAKGRKSIGPVKDIALRYAEIRALEHMTTDRTVDCDVLGRDIAKFTGAMIDDTLRTASKRVANIGLVAQQKVTRTVVGLHGPHNVRVAKGLANADVTYLKTVETSCKNLSDDIDVINSGLAEPLPISAGVPSAIDVGESAHTLLRTYNVEE